MEAPLRLDTLSAELGRLFRGAGDLQRVAGVLVACHAAVAETGLQGAEIDAALALIETGASDAALGETLNASSLAFDDYYFDLSEDTDEIPFEAMRSFGKARASAALAYAISGNRAELAEALYEAISAVSDPAVVLGRVAARLGG